MKTKLITAGMLLIAVVLGRAATNDLTSALQKGLFEEEANHNLDAAAQAYQTVSAQFDKDRKLAATAIFRLGEVYRKQGKTNEATAQYERIVREFSDQPTLATLSRQNLTRLGANQATTSTAEPDQSASVPPTPEAEELARTEKILLQLKDWDLPQLRRLIPKLAPDAEFELLETQLAQSESLNNAYGENLFKQQMEDRATAILKTLDRRAQSLREVVSKQLAASKAVSPSSENKTSIPPVTDDEEKEIRRLQAMIQNSPDLINAPSEGVNGDLTPLCSTASKGQLRVVKFLLDNGAAIDRRGNNSTPLHLAALNGQKAMVELLLDRGAEINVGDGTGMTALHAAALHGFRSVAETLLARKADVNARDRHSSTPLHLAAERGHVELINLLLAKGADVNAVESQRGRTPLGNAVFGHRSTALKALLAANANPNIEDQKGRSLLSYAAQDDDLESFKALLEAKADPNAGKLDLPLMRAIERTNVVAVELLLQHGAKANEESVVSWQVQTPMTLYPQGGTFAPLQLAVFKSSVPLVKLLLDHKADPNFKVGGAEPGAYPLSLMAMRISPESFKAFLDAGASANAEDEYSQPLLCVAASESRPAVVEQLLAHGAEVNARDPNDGTPLMRAAGAGDRKSAELLLAAKADAKAATRDGTTALHLAVNQGSKEMVELLLAHGADPNARNQKGQTPLDYAKNGAPSSPEFGRTRGAGFIPQPSAPPTPRSIPTRTLRQPAGAQGEAKVEPGDLAGLLRQHGALDELPAFDRIQITRPAANLSRTIFRKNKIEESPFTLLDVLGVQYQFLNENTAGGWGKREDTRLLTINDFRADAFSFPEFSKVRLRRPATDGKSWDDKLVDVAALLRDGDCGQNLALKWGDEVVIPETDHGLGERWDGFTRAGLKTFNQCLSRTVSIVIKGQATKVTIGPKFEYLDTSATPYVTTGASLWIRPVLFGSNLLLASSDLARVKVTRTNGGKQREWVLDCSGNNAPDFWLRDGDVIEVPDKP